VLATFDAAYAAQTPEAFARDILAGGLSACAVVVGYDFTFGQGRSGTPDTLRALAPRLGFAVDVVPPVTDGGEPVSSSRIRRALQAGNVQTAARLLGQPFALRGTVVRGHRRGGAALGFPTANLAPESAVLPATGVYAGWVRVVGAAGEAERAGEPGSPPAERGASSLSAKGGEGGESDVRRAARPFPAAINVGTAPTFGPGEPRTVEAHLLDFDGDLYGRRVDVAFADRIRDERRFEGIEPLKAQIAADVAAVRERLR
jgi:riboflavin kinase/FMN adenylyltransferase